MTEHFPDSIPRSRLRGFKEYLATVLEEDLSAAVQEALDEAETAYQKPSGGIPATDMATAVQSSLGKADSALQSGDLGYTKPGSGIPASDLAQAVQDSLEAADDAYPLPGTGIPASDMAAAVQSSLGKADSALQSGLTTPAANILASQEASSPTVSEYNTLLAFMKTAGLMVADS